MPRVAKWLRSAYDCFIQSPAEWSHSRSRHEVSFIRIQRLETNGTEESIWITSHWICMLDFFASPLSLLPILSECNLISGQAFINLSPTAPLSNADLKHSMHKTYTDCYFAEGFTGGSWEYAVNTNNTDELLQDDVEEQVVEEGQRRLACYPLGWESMEVWTSSFPWNGCRGRNIITATSTTKPIPVLLCLTKR